VCRPPVGRDQFGGVVCSVPYVRLMPGCDLVASFRDRLAELADFGRAGVVLEVGAEAADELEYQFGVGVFIDRSAT